jgi:bifunctional non-homologous end joining protein LigD
MLATSGQPPRAAGWAFEFKWDGVRAIVAAAGQRLRITSRAGNDVTAGYPEISRAALGARHTLLLDGELVVLDARGRPDFGLLQHRMHVRNPSEQLTARAPVSLYVFDLLHLDGQSLIHQPYDTRRAQLADLGLDQLDRVDVPPSVTEVSSAQLLQIARIHGLEGIVAKRRASRYEPGRRSPAWIKTALLNTQEVIIGGWSPGEGRRARTLGALLLGAHDTQGRLRYLGQVGTGFTETMLTELMRQLRPLRRPGSPFDEPVPREHARDARWVQPQLVGEVVYRTLTPEGRLRHTAWRGLRPDRDPDEITIALPTEPAETP